MVTYRYSTTIHTFQLQHQNEMLLPQFKLDPLTMTEIEVQLYAIDENTQNSRHLVYQAKTQKQKLKNQIHNKNNRNHVICQLFIVMNTIKWVIMPTNSQKNC